MKESEVGMVQTRARFWAGFGLLLFFVITGVAGCQSLKSSEPIVPLAEYERMLVGRLDADYVGSKNCLAACHYHDQIRLDFEASTMGAQMSADSGMPLVDCESCHGPGSLAIEGLTPEKVAADAAVGKQTPCRYETLIDLKNLPAQAQSLLCLKCHSANATFNLHEWNAGAHAVADVSCFPCHDIHAGPDLIVSPKETKEMCFKCHKEKEAEFLLPSHHPVMEGKSFCTDCHQPHGSFHDSLMREETIRASCVRCHGEVEGPYVYAHADLMNEDCTICHANHGSVNNNLLKLSQPYLCLQCHVGHRTSANPVTGETKGAFYTRCTDCHSQIHGTDIPSASGRGNMTQ
ncbi:MAG: DmsE family decaheme c-type cytochrome [Desulfobulbales bacterium]|nr:DmsE family decaheme c-type cytochrome [Desulfobulbales bacterium]